ncbi:MAG: 30S ribosomal protein S18 [bacterium]|nr:30S ribosomal protein S18 [bacterium]
MKSHFNSYAAHPPAARAKQCFFCTSNIKNTDYKDQESLKRFLDPQSRILPRRRSGVCATHQRKLARAVKRARIMGLLPFVSY